MARICGGTEKQRTRPPHHLSPFAFSDCIWRKRYRLTFVSCLLSYRGVFFELVVLCCTFSSPTCSCVCLVVFFLWYCGDLVVVVHALDVTCFGLLWVVVVAAACAAPA